VDIHKPDDKNAAPLPFKSNPDETLVVLYLLTLA
jgi:hypothetical protein